MSETYFQNSFKMFKKRCGYDPNGVAWDGNHQDVPEGIRKELEILETQLYSQAGRNIQEFELESSTKFRWLNGGTMQIIWPTGSKDLIFLTESRTFCEFSGIFVSDVIQSYFGYCLKQSFLLQKSQIREFWSL